MHTDPSASPSHHRLTTLQALASILALTLTLACGGGNSNPGAATQPPEQQAATPAISTTAAQNGAVIVTLKDATAGATLYYTTDGTIPTNTSPQYYAPFLVDSSITVNAIAAEPPGYTNSKVASQTFSPGIASGTLVWSDEFSSSAASAQPSPSTWTYDTGTNCCGNNELETYCAWGSTTGPCAPSNPNAYMGSDGYLHIVAANPSAAVYTSARLKSQGLFSFQYGRIEARILDPESQGMWPAFWLLGNNIATASWPACGETDVMEHIDGNNPPFSVGQAPPGYDWVQSSVHGTNLNGGTPYHPAGFSAAAWHTYGMIWTKGQIQFYIDDPSNIYETFTPANTAGTWPFDQGPMFILLNLAVGGQWPGNPNASTVFPSQMLVDYVRVYTN